MQVLDNYGATVWFVLREAREDGTPLEASQALPLLPALMLAENWTRQPYDWEGDLIPTNAGISLLQDRADGLAWLWHDHKKGWVFNTGKSHVSANDFVARLRQQALSFQFDKVN